MSPSGFPFLVYFINLNSSTLFWILKHSGVIFETLAQKSLSVSQPQSCKKARLETRMKLTHIPCTIVFKATLGWRSCLSAALSLHQTGRASSHCSSGERSQGHYRPHIKREALCIFYGHCTITDTPISKCSGAVWVSPQIRSALTLFNTNSFSCKTEQKSYLKGCYENKTT